MSAPQPQCAACPYEWSERFCAHDHGKAPGNCPSTRHQDLASESLDAVNSPSVHEFARQASIQEAEGYCDREKGYDRVRPVKPRIVETIEFARKMGYQRVALVFCAGLRREAAIVHEIFEAQGLDVISIVCKVGKVPKEAMGLREDQKVAPGHYESMCNPIMQALVANHYQSQFNVLLGLCVGHDSLFFRYADAPSTVLAVKDRMLGHNPLAAVYEFGSYYRYLKQPIE
ncbi:MAG: DUF1847 domain-containing protein [Syntrophobacteraceae bacterium]